MAARTCIVTGASRGIGLATALRFARQGCNIVAAARNAADLAEAEEKIAATDVGCRAVPADVSRREGVQQLVTAAIEQFGRVDVLVNNAGCAPLQPIDEMPDEAFDEVAALNMGAIFHATRAVWSIMKQQGGGVIVNVSSVASVDPFPGFALYGASKAWVNLFTQATAAEGKPLGIRVYAIAPGAVETRMMRALMPDLPDKHVLEPDTVAAVIESVVDPAWAPTTGQTIFVKK